MEQPAERALHFNLKDSAAKLPWDRDLFAFQDIQGCLVRSPVNGALLLQQDGKVLGSSAKIDPGLQDTSLDCTTVCQAFQNSASLAFRDLSYPHVRVARCITLVYLSSFLLPFFAICILYVYLFPFVLSIGSFKKEQEVVLHERH